MILNKKNNFIKKYTFFHFWQILYSIFKTLFSELDCISYRSIFVSNNFQRSTIVGRIFVLPIYLGGGSLTWSHWTFSRVARNPVTLNLITWITLFLLSFHRWSWKGHRWNRRKIKFIVILDKYCIVFIMKKVKINYFILRSGVFLKAWIKWFLL